MLGPLLIIGHGGLGDLLITNGLTRCLADRHSLVLVACKAVYVQSLVFAYRDAPNIQLLPIARDSDISPMFGADPAVLVSFAKAGFGILLLGLHRGPLPAGVSFADAFYDQAGVPRNARYTRFHVRRDPDIERALSTKHARFVHDDPPRGFHIDRPQGDEFHPGPIPPGGSSNIFAYLGAMEAADRLDLMDSSFAHLADLFDLASGRRYMHTRAKNALDDLPGLFRRPGWRFV